MNKLKLLGVASFFVTGLAQAAVPCNGYEIKVRNELPFDLKVKQIELKNATISPNQMQLKTIKRDDQQNFVISKSVANIPMDGVIVLESPEGKTTRFNFQLTNVAEKCKHVNLVSDGGGYILENREYFNNVNYIIK